MAQQTIGIGTVANDGTGDPLRTAFDKTNDNFDELYLVKHNAWMPRRKSGFYYWGGPPDTNMLSTSAVSTTTTYWLPQVFERDVTLSEFGLSVSTLGGNAQVALYAMHTDGKPTGVRLAGTSSINVSTTGLKSGAISGGTLHSGGQAIIPAGEYMWGLQFDNTATRCIVPLNTSAALGVHGGSSTLAALGFAASNVSNPSFTLTGGTFGTWPDVTGASFTQSTTFDGARPLYKVA